MLVSPTGAHGTIGGGQMEHMAIDHARALLAGVSDAVEMDIPLGPDIGQCCGGRMVLTFRIGDDAARAALALKLKEKLKALPQVWLFGAGHVGRALADALLLLPLKIFAVETRKNEPRPDVGRCQPPAGRHARGGRQGYRARVRRRHPDA